MDALSPNRAIPAVPRAQGSAGALALLALDLGLITFAQDRPHARKQFVADRPFVLANVVRFGTQFGFFSYLRQLKSRPSLVGISASNVASAPDMLVCCARHVSDVLPLISLSGAAIFFTAYKPPLRWLSIAANLLGVLLLLRQVQRAPVPPDAL